MFEAVNNITSKGSVSGKDAFSSQIIPFKTPAPAGDQKTPGKEIHQTGNTGQTVQEAEQAEKDRNGQVTEKMLSELERDIETIHSIGLQFSKHDESGRTVIKVMDRQSHELIREIPSEEVLNLATKIDEMIGILFDKKV